MSLAARCPACGTVFRVVQDQLRVSEGWVRCGRCAEVFNAIEGLVDLEADGAGAAAANPRGRDRVIDDLAQVSQAGSAAAESALAPESDSSAREANETNEAPDAHEASLSGDANSVDSGADVDPQAPAASLPPFLRRAERAARWRRPHVRATLALLAITAAAVMAAQVGLAYRDLIAARWPGTRSALERICGSIGCSVDAPRSIEALTVESSGLVRVEGTSLYRLSVVLRNRGSMALVPPAMDLSLTDSRGDVIARRVITLAEIGMRQSSVPALAELPIHGTIAVGGRPISGYTIEIFYP